MYHSYLQEHVEHVNKITLDKDDYDKFMPKESIILISNKIGQAEEEVCSICQDSLRGKAGAHLRTIQVCNHTFHGNCLLEWLKISESCPNCKEVLTKSRMLSKVATNSTLISSSLKVDTVIIPARTISPSLSILKICDSESQKSE